MYKDKEDWSNDLRQGDIFQLPYATVDVPQARPAFDSDNFPAMDVPASIRIRDELFISLAACCGSTNHKEMVCAWVVPVEGLSEGELRAWRRANDFSAVKAAGRKDFKYGRFFIEKVPGQDDNKEIDGYVVHFDRVYRAVEMTREEYKGCKIAELTNETRDLLRENLDAQTRWSREEEEERSL